MACSCLAAKVYNAGAALAEVDLYVVDPATTACTARDFLLYFYYAGLIFIGAAPNFLSL